MKLAFVWDWNSVDQQTIGWMDGLSAALRELSKRHHVGVFTCGEYEREIEHPYFQIHVRKHIPQAIKNFNPDVVLHFADMTRPNAKPIFELNIPQALCFTGGNPLGENVDLFEHIFVESEVYRLKFQDHGYTNCSIAFGANTELFKPIPEQNKVFDTIFPATFASWKRHDLYAHATQGFKSLAVGWIQPNGIDEESWKECYRNGVTVLPHVTAEVLRYLYAASRVCVVTSSSAGGSQRTVLEAMAMNIPLVITDSDKFDMAWGHGVFESDPRDLRGTIKALLDGEHEVNTRDFVLENFSEFVYADKLEKELLKLV